MDAPQSIAQAIQDVVHGAFGRHMPILLRRVGRQSFAHRLGRHPRIGQRRLELRIGLALRIDQGVDFVYQFRVLLFGFAPAASREIVHAANPGAEFVQPGIDGIPPPTEDLFGSTRITLDRKSVV